MNKLGNRIKELRNNSNLSLRALGLKVGIKDNTLSRYENEQRKIPANVETKLADFFNVSVPYLKGAYSKKQLAKIVQQEYKKGASGLKKMYTGKAFFIPVAYRWISTIENYLISIGTVPYNVPKENLFLADKQINNLDFWLKNLEPVFKQVSVRWLLEKPGLNANKEEVKEALSSAMLSITQKAAIVNNDITANYGKWDEQYFAKRMEYLRKHTFYETEFPDNNHKRPVTVPYYDFKRENI